MIHRERFAPAKVNLYLHVGPLSDDGYHPLQSLMVFADVGDHIQLRAAEAMSFVVAGTFGDDLRGQGENLVTRARDQFLAACSEDTAPFCLTLRKDLPLAAGLGGGSSDAAATLRLVNQAFGSPVDEATLNEIALNLGSDTPACLRARAVLASGRGEVLAPPPAFATLDVVLVNPGLPCPTGAVYRAFDDNGAPGGCDLVIWPKSVATQTGFVDFLGDCRNDLEGPAITVQPEIRTVLHSLADRPQSLLTRMSGSGATCFALCPDAASAHRLAADIAGDHPTWWVKPCRLGGSAN